MKPTVHVRALVARLLIVFVFVVAGTAVAVIVHDDAEANCGGG